METVKIYHAIAVVAIFLIGIISTLTENTNFILIIGFGVSIILLLGIHLILDRQENDIQRLEKKITEMSLNIESIKVVTEFSSKLSNDQQVALMKMISELHEEICKLKANK